MKRLNNSVDGGHSFVSARAWTRTQTLSDYKAHALSFAGPNRPAETFANAMYKQTRSKKVLCEPGVLSLT